MSDIRVVLAIASPPADAHETLAWASRIAGDHDAVVDAAFVRRDWAGAPGLTAYGYYASPAILEQLAQEAERAENEARSAFERAEAAAPGGRLRRFVTVADNPDRGLAAATRAADLTVALLPGETHDMGRETALSLAAMEGGGPVFGVPPGHSPQSPLAHVAVAWDESAEAARAMRGALGFLKAAQKVTLITVQESDVPAPVMADAASYLAAHGVEAEGRFSPRKSGGEGAVILEEAAAAGADMLVMGAYGRAQWVEQMFGGATWHAVRHARIPLLLAH